MDSVSQATAKAMGRAMDKVLDKALANNAGLEAARGLDRAMASFFMGATLLTSNI